MPVVSTGPRVAFICADPVGEEMAGLGIRNWELARVAAGHAQVTIAHGGREIGEVDGIRLVAYRPHDPVALRGPVDTADVVVAHPQWPVVARHLRRSRATVVIDLYDPETLETLELLSGRSPLVRRQLTAATLDRLHDALLTGNHFMCASETQRDLWLGSMLALRTLSPQRYDQDPTLRSLIDVVPFGLPTEPPSPDGGPGPREILGLAADAEIVLWNGGIWQWLDSELAIRAIARLRERRPSAVLVFMGGAGDHPAARGSADRARALAQQLGLLGQGVVFHDGWVPYAQRSRWLLAADCAVSAARDHLETRFAFRTRVLDCLWAGLPVACTTGDDLAERVAREGLGATAAPGDAEALATALGEILERGRAAYAPALRDAALKARWERAAQPLLDWIAEAGRPARPTASRGLARPLGQRVRDVVYSAGGRRLLARRSR